MTNANGTKNLGGTTAEQTALVLSYSEIATDPRVRREIDWLRDAGWRVDTLGLGDHSAREVERHYRLRDSPHWTRGRLGTLISHVLVPARWRFRLLLTDRVPLELRSRIQRGEYGLIVFNEFEFAPWVEDGREFGPQALRGLRHLDLHEFRNPNVRRRTLGGRLTGSHYRWVRKHLGSVRFTSRTVVNTQIGQLYADEFGFPVPAEVRNAPAFVPDLNPSPVDPTNIRLLFHGLPSWRRGFVEILTALEELPAHFSMTFMLMPNPSVHARLRAAIASHPARERIHIVPPAPMREITQRINQYDVEIIFYKPYEPNLQYAMPNKFFEAAQARLAIVVGETPTMASIVREYGHGVVVPEFTARALRETIAALTVERVERMKENAAVAAAAINSASEGAAFLSAISAARSGTAAS